MKDFFDFSIESSFGGGFGLYSAAHFAFLAGCALLCAALCAAYRRQGLRGRRRLRLAVSAAMTALQLLRALLLMLAGEYGLSRLPLHLCSMAVYICLFHALTGRSGVWQFLYAFCLPGAVCALLFPDWTYYPALHFISLSSFALHALITAYVLMGAVSGELRPQARRLPALLGIMLALAAAVYAFNCFAGTNFMFLRYPAPGSPLEWFVFLGSPGYILGYFPLLALVWAVEYLPFTLPAAHNNKYPPA